jgi:F0F1-type ATP synthase membrane subunit c/vacuolar-type H+-ATPase subunit K
MSPFELVFAVFGLLLGLAVAEVLGGFSRAVKLKRGTRPVRVGWLTPLLGLLVMLDLTSFWMVAWDAREQIDANYVTLVGVLTMVGIYYLAATLIFPDTPEEWPDFDDWYDKQNRMVVGGLLTANVASWIGVTALEIAHPSPELPATAGSDLALTIYLVSGLGILALLVALMIVKRRRWNVAVLVVLIVLIVVSGVVEPYVA